MYNYNKLHSVKTKDTIIRTGILSLAKRIFWDSKEKSLNESCKVKYGSIIRPVRM